VDIIVDTSELIAVIANEPEKDALVELTLGADLIAPLSVHWEIRHVISAMPRQKRTTLALALNAIELYERIPIRFVEVELDESLRLADALGICAYGAYLIRCAQEYRSPILSLDGYLLECASRTEVEILEANQ
jgi:predicted nucleic acid-binding protein